MAETRWLTRHEEETWVAFLLATHLLFGQLNRELEAEAGLPLADYDILAGLSHAPGRAMRMSQLAALWQFSRSRLSHAIARLEALGWVRREHCPTDRRGAFAVLTDKGFAVLQAAAPGHVEGVRAHLFDQLTGTQLAQLRQISQALLRHLAPPEHAAFLPPGIFGVAGEAERLEGDHHDAYPEGECAHGRAGRSCTSTS